MFALAAVTIVAAGCTPNLGASTRGWGAVAVGDGVVYATTLNGQVYALNDLLSEGVSTRWVSTVGDDEGFRGTYNPPAVGRYVYVSGIDGFLYAIDSPAGGGAAETAWRRPQVESEEMVPLVGSPALDEAGGIIAVGSEDGGLYAFNALDRRGSALVAVPDRGRNMVDSRAAQWGGLLRIAGRQRVRGQPAQRGTGVEV